MIYLDEDVESDYYALPVDVQIAVSELEFALAQMGMQVQVIEAVESLEMSIRITSQPKDRTSFSGHKLDS